MELNRSTVLRSQLHTIAIIRRLILQFETPFGDHGGIDDARIRGRDYLSNAAVNDNGRLAGLARGLTFEIRDC